VTADPSSPDAPDRAAVFAALDAVRDPKSGRGLVEARLVRGLTVGPGRVGFMMEIAPEDLAVYEPVRAEAEAALRALPGVDKAQVVLTTEDAPAPPAPGVTRVRRGAALSPEAERQGQPGPPAGALKPAHVGHVLAVASGKGGVGKSTVAVNLACALARLGYRVGLLDADVYGPSAPTMFGIDDDPELGPDKKLVPLEAWGVKVISIGFLVDPGRAMIWRGPMASSAINQLLNDVAWGTAEEPLDVLVVDMPPGTGDIQLTMVQRVALAGAVLVSTPQEVALIDVRRGAAMFEKTAIPILGVVENMAYFTDPTTGTLIPIFGRGGARATAEALGAPFLGEVPIDMALREACDAGRPLVASAPESAPAQAFMAIAEQVAAALKVDAARPAPSIVID
jgi:ATP-binding protein involved in chromosome partitioning